MLDEILKPNRISLDPTTSRDSSKPRHEGEAFLLPRITSTCYLRLDFTRRKVLLIYAKFLNPLKTTWQLAAAPSSFSDKMFQVSGF